MPEALWLVFIAAVGASIGSFLNVLAFRMPRGQSVVKPASRCPACGQTLRWRDNIPVLGWILLKGRCRYCRVPVSARYPVVEAVTAMLFVGWALVCYHTGLRPGFALSDAGQTAPVFLVTLVFLAALLAASLIDAEYFIIPLVIPWVSVAVAAVVYPLAVHFSPTLHQEIDLASGGESGLFFRESLGKFAEVELGFGFGGSWQASVAAVPWAGDGLTAAAIGAALGWGLSLLLLRLGVLPRSFEMPEQDMPDTWPTRPQGPRQLILLLAPIGAAVAAGLWMDRDWAGRWEPLMPLMRLGFCALGAYVLAAALLLLAGRLVRTQDSDRQEAASEAEAKFPQPAHPRLEMVKEAGFIAGPLLGALAGFWLLGGRDFSPAVQAAGGVLSGCLIAAGLAWGVRILGTLGFGREAMGLGDVHLMAAMGAVLGWREAILSFFLAAAVGLGHMLLVSGFGRYLKWRGQHIPFGPHLAAAAGVVMILREPLVVSFGLLLGL